MPEEQRPKFPATATSETDATSATKTGAGKASTAKAASAKATDAKAAAGTTTKVKDSAKAKDSTTVKDSAKGAGAKVATAKDADAKDATTKTKGKTAKTATTSTDAEVATKPSAKKKVVKYRSRAWVPWVFCTLGLVGLVWLVLWYLAGPQIGFMMRLGDINILIGMGLIAAAFVVATLWK